MSIGSFLHNIGAHLASFFGSHAAVIATVTSDAQIAVGAAKVVAADLGEPASVQTVLGNISDGLTKVAATATAEATADTLTEQAANLTGLVGGLVSSGDIGIKNAGTKVAVGTALVKVTSVVSALETAANAASASAAQ